MSCDLFKLCLFSNKENDRIVSNDDQNGKDLLGSSRNVEMTTVRYDE